MSTIEEVARNAGLPVPTVRRILRGDNKEIWASAKRRGDRVRRLAQDLGYRPNASARATRSGEFGAIGVISRVDIGAEQLAVNAGLHEALDQRGLHMMAAHFEETHIGDPDATPRLMRELCVDGLIVHYARNVPAEVREFVAGSRVPVIWVNTKGERNCVYPDDEQGGRFAVEQLLARGARAITYVRRSDRPNQLPRGVHYSEAEREAGYAVGMLNAGLTPSMVDPGTFTRTPAGEMAGWRRFVRDLPRGHHVLCYGLREASAVIQAALMEGRAVPDDLSVTCMHHTGSLSVGPIRPMVAVVPLRQAGLAAVPVLLDMIEHGQQEAPSVAVPYTEFDAPDAPRSGTRDSGESARHESQP